MYEQEKYYSVNYSRLLITGKRVNFVNVPMTGHSLNDMKINYSERFQYIVNSEKEITKAEFENFYCGW